MEDFFYKYLKYYTKMPLKLKWFIGLIYRLLPISIRYGHFYNKYSNRIKYFESIDKNEIEKTQEKLLFETVNYALKNIEFYKKKQRLFVKI